MKSSLRFAAAAVSFALLVGCTSDSPPQEDVIDNTEQVRAEVERLAALAADAVLASAPESALTEEQNERTGQFWSGCDDQLHGIDEVPDMVAWTYWRELVPGVECDLRPRVDAAVAALMERNEGWTGLRAIDDDFQRVIAADDAEGYTVAFDGAAAQVIGRASMVVEAVSACVAALDDLHTRAPQRP